MKNNGLGRSFACAWAGLGYAIRSQRNMKIHCLAVVVVIAAGMILGVSRIDWAILSLTIFMVLAAEVINTAVEKVVDLASPEFHPLARQAKNLAAGAVLLTALNALIIAFIIFGLYIH